jgi:DNA invertase Pin-like site-specific DNA recombinase
MVAYAPQSRTRPLMEQKRAIARRLLAQGLTNTQIRAQLRCSAAFLRRVQEETQEEHERL